MNKNIISTPHAVTISKDGKIVLTLDTIKFLREVIKTGRNNVLKYLEEHKNDTNRNTPILLPPITTSFVSSTKNAPHVDYCMWTNCEAGPSIIDDSVIYYRMSYYEEIQVNCREVWINRGLKQINIKQPSMSMLTGNIFFKNVLRTFFENNPDGNLTKICDKIKEEHKVVGLDNPFFVGPNAVACDNYKYHCYYTEMSDQNQPFMFNAIGLLRDYNDDDDDFSFLYSKSCIGFNANHTTISFECERHIRTLMGELKSKRTDTSKRYNGIFEQYTPSPEPAKETNNPKEFEEEESMEENKVMTDSTSLSENKEPHDPDDLSGIISVLDKLSIFGMENGFDEEFHQNITIIKEHISEIVAFWKFLREFVEKKNEKEKETTSDECN